MSDSRPHFQPGMPLQAERARSRSGPRRKAPTIGPGERRSQAPPRRGPVGSCSDGELIRRIGHRDREAFEALYQRFAGPVFRLSVRKLGDHGHAEDATQETFTAIWRFAASYRPERAPGAPWLYAVARNAIVDQTRKRSEAAGQPLDWPSDQPGPPERAESAWVSSRVCRALEELTERQRALIELAYRGELSQSAIATRLSMPLGTVKTRTRRALAGLADLLEQAEVR